MPASPRTGDHLLGAPARLQGLARTDLLDSPAELAFDRMTRLVTRVLGVPVSLVSLVDDSRQFFKSAAGLAEPWATARETPLSHSFCQHVVTADAPLVVADARADERVAGNRAVEELDVVAYLGAPVHGPGGLPIGSLCAISPEPRSWTEDDLHLLVDLAAAISEMVALRTAAAERRAAVLDLSHEMRTGLTALRLEVEDAGAEVADGPSREVVRRLGAALQTRSAQLSDALSAIEDGLSGLEQDVDVARVLEQVRQEAVHASAERRVVVSADGLGGTAVLRTVEADLHRVVRAVVDVLLEHGAGDITLTVLTTASAVRVRICDDGDGLPVEARWLLTGRTDGGGADGSVAQRAARTLGGRLVLVGSRPNTVDLLLPRA